MSVKAHLGVDVNHVLVDADFKGDQAPEYEVTIRQGSGMSCVAPQGSGGYGGGPRRTHN